VPVDTASVVVLFAIFGALLASCGVGLSALGIGMLVEGNTAGIGGIVCGLPACYGAYLFGRAAIRLRRDLHDHPLSVRQRRTRQGKLRYLLFYTASLIAAAVMMPVPTGVRVLLGVGAVLVVPLFLAREFEPAKNHDSSGG
jgi:hypothetical protein